MPARPTRLLPEDASLPDASMHLMPFHIAYDGPAAVSTRFLPLNSEANEATFRGRLLHATTLALPESYQGIVAHVSANTSFQSLAKQPPIKRKAPPAPAPRPDAKRLRQSPRKQAQRAQAKPSFSLDTPPSSPDQGPSLVQVEPTHAPLDEDEEEEQEDEEEPLSDGFIDLKPVSRFSSIQIWAPDAPLDTGDDIFWKSITEWTKMAELIHGGPPSPTSS